MSPQSAGSPQKCPSLPASGRPRPCASGPPRSATGAHRCSGWSWPSSVRGHAAPSQHCTRLQSVRWRRSVGDREAEPMDSASRLPSRAPAPRHGVVVHRLTVDREEPSVRRTLRRRRRDVLCQHGEEVIGQRNGTLGPVLRWKRPCSPTHHAGSAATPSVRAEGSQCHRPEHPKPPDLRLLRAEGVVGSDGLPDVGQRLRHPALWRDQSEGSGRAVLIPDDALNHAVQA